MSAELEVGKTFWERTYRHAERVVSRRIAGRTFLIPVSGKLADMQRIFAPNSVGSYIWEQLNGEFKLQEVREKVAFKYCVDRNRVGQDVEEYVQELLGAGLIEEVH